MLQIGQKTVKNKAEQALSGRVGIRNCSWNLAAQIIYNSTLTTHRRATFELVV
ncbi:uncharacterized protein METZ01_LOCUS102368 [marine metagenome]|uniref:Uncharacterized protein n=1 Tax=marine metagenome TaxID=408172 RepID=A0A381WAL4_9ZZZZ|tara:strand:+ start:2058 stop:2216 length:159 start_codon:yes stop_codon:yes gene_type:complete